MRKDKVCTVCRKAMVRHKRSLKFSIKEIAKSFLAVNIPVYECPECNTTRYPAQTMRDLSEVYHAIIEDAQIRAAREEKLSGLYIRKDNVIYLNKIKFNGKAKEVCV